MRCEVVAVGTELLLGQIVDTNSSWIGEQLALSGIDSLHQTKVGDNLGRIVGAIELALSRSDAVIVCGGLGPTHDDITRDAIAQVMGVPLQLDEEVAARIEAMFSSRGRRMPANNFRQAEVPEGATAIRDPQPGTAPGLICPVLWPREVGERTRQGGEASAGDEAHAGDARQERVIYAVPGVPYEMEAIVAEAILPDLRRRAGQTSVIRSRTLRTWGESESGLAELLSGRIGELDRSGTATIAFLASGIEGIKVRVTAKGATEAEVDAVLAEEESVLRGLLGDLVFGVDEETMETAVVRLLQHQQLTLALAESMTGGLISARITNVPGVSGTYLGGVVSYASEVKWDLLEVPPGAVVTAEAAEAMARGVRRLLGSDVGLAITGVAGPESQDGEPPGTVFIGLALGDDVDSIQIRLPGDRDRVRQFGTISALDLLRHRLLGSEGGRGWASPAAR